MTRLGNGWICGVPLGVSVGAEVALWVGVLVGVAVNSLVGVGVALLVEGVTVMVVIVLQSPPKRMTVADAQPMRPLTLISNQE